MPPPRATQIKTKGLAGQLVTHLLGFEQEDENFEIAQDFCLENVSQHRFADTEWRKVERSMTGMVEKMSIHNNAKQAADLGATFKAYQGSIPQSLNPDPYYDIIRLLVELSSTRKQKALKGDAPMHLKQYERRAPKVEPTWAEIGLDPDVQGLETEWQEDYAASLYEQAHTGFAEGDEGEDHVEDFVQLIAEEEDEQTEEQLLFREEVEGEVEGDEDAFVGENNEGDDDLYTVVTQALDRRRVAAAQGTRWEGEEEGAIYDEEDRALEGMEGGLGVRTLDGGDGAVALFELESDFASTGFSIGGARYGEGRAEGALEAAARRPEKAWNALHWRLRQQVAHGLEVEQGSALDGLGRLDSLYLSSPAMVPESALVHQVILLLHGIPGPVFTFDHLARAFCFTQRVAVSHLSLGALGSFLQIFVDAANEQKRVVHFVTHFGGHTSSFGRVFQSLCEEITTLSGLQLRLARFESRAKDPASREPVSLVALQAWLWPEMELTSFLANLCAHIAKSAPTADELLTLLHESFSRQCAAGSTRWVNVLSRLLVRALAPYLEMLSAWTADGLVEDPCEEFMVLPAEDMSDLQGDDAWRRSFTFRMRKLESQADEEGGRRSPVEEVALPAFLLPMAQKILVTGKALNLIKLIKGTSTALHDPGIRTSLHAQFWESLRGLAALSNGASAPPAPASHAPSAVAMRPAVESETSDMFHMGRSLVQLGGDSWTTHSKYDVDSLLSSMTTHIAPATARIGQGRTATPRDGEGEADRRVLEAFAEASAFLPPAFQLIPVCLLNHLQARHDRASRELKSLLFGKCHLVEHLRALREGFLLENASVTAELAFALFARLDKPDEDAQTIGTALVDALRSSALCDQHLADHITVEVNKEEAAGASTIGRLQCLIIKPNIAWPLNIVITEESTVKYNKIFVFLLQLLRAKQALEEMTKQSSKGRTRRTPVVHQFFVLKAHFYSFVHNIHAYVMGRVVDGVWGAFTEEAEGFEGADLEQLRDLHDKYLDKIMHQTLLFTQGSGVLSAVRKILNLCLDLQRLHTSHLFDFINQPGNIPDDPQLQASIANVASQRLNVVKREFQQHLRFLLVFLAKFVETGHHPHLEDVLTRLNFNAFYSTTPPTTDRRTSLPGEQGKKVS
jgi:hypothetical protein